VGAQDYKFTPMHETMFAPFFTTFRCHFHSANSVTPPSRD